MHCSSPLRTSVHPEPLPLSSRLMESRDLNSGPITNHHCHPSSLLITLSSRLSAAFHSSISICIIYQHLYHHHHKSSCSPSDSSPLPISLPLYDHSCWESGWLPTDIQSNDEALRSSKVTPHFLVMLTVQSNAHPTSWCKDYGDSGQFGENEAPTRRLRRQKPQPTSTLQRFSSNHLRIPCPGDLLAVSFKLRRLRA